MLWVVLNAIQTHGVRSMDTPAVLSFRLVRRWHRLPGELVDAAPLQTPIRLDGTLST